MQQPLAQEAATCCRSLLPVAKSRAGRRTARRGEGTIFAARTSTNSGTCPVFRSASSSQPWSEIGCVTYPRTTRLLVTATVPVAIGHRARGQRARKTNNRSSGRLSVTASRIRRRGRDSCGSPSARNLQVQQFQRRERWPSARNVKARGTNHRSDVGNDLPLKPRTVWV